MKKTARALDNQRWLTSRQLCVVKMTYAESVRHGMSGGHGGERRRRAEKYTARQSRNAIMKITAIMINNASMRSETQLNVSISRVK